MKRSIPFSSVFGHLFLAALLMCAIAQCVQAQRSKLTELQVLHLIQVHAPDNLVATQIQVRGISFEVTPAEVKSLSAKGAGPQTLAALRALIQTGTIEIRTEPGATVSFDGTSAGVADAQGVLTFENIPPGTHNLLVAKDGFHSTQQSITLRNHEVRQLSAPLAWAGGVLTVSVQPNSASIVVTGPVSFSGPLIQIRCPPGSYTVRAALNGYVPQEHTFTITADQVHEESIQLLVDRTALAKSLEDSETRLMSGDPAAAIILAGHVLTLDPSNVEAHAVLAEASFVKGDLQTFVQNAIPAVRGGKIVSLPMMQVHIFPRRYFDNVEVTISSSGLGFHCLTDAKCKIPKSLTYDLIGQIGVMNEPTNSFETLHVGWFEHPHAFIIHDLDFVPLGSGMVDAQRQPGVIAFSTPKVAQIPGDSVEEYRAILSVISSVRR